MQPLPIMILVFGAVFMLGLLAIAFTGPNAKRESARRLQAVRLRHSENAVDKVEAQFRKAVAQRKPTSYKLAGSQSRREALRLRLLRTGKGCIAGPAVDGEMDGYAATGRIMPERPAWTSTAVS